MTRILVVIAITTLIVGTIIPASQQMALAQSKRLTCDTTKDCNIIIRRLSVGDDLIIQFKASPPAGGGGGTTAGTVDQQARDDITNLKSVDVQHSSDIATLQTQNSALQNQTTALSAENQALRNNLTVVTNALVLNTQAITELQGVVNNITEANPFVNITIPNQGNETTGPGEQPNVPPQGNETNGVGENATTTPPVEGNAGNITIPGNNETTTSPPAGNESNNNNNTTTGPIITNPICDETHPCITIPPNATGNVTGNITLPIEGNVTVPETNVTLPVDNSSGNIIVGPGNATGNESGNDSGTIVQNSSGQDIVDFRSP